jgi:DNA-binding MarR family transcriptional regulator
MQKVFKIGSLLKRLYRFYGQELIDTLQLRGFADLRPSFLEVLLAIAEQDSPTIRQVGQACGLKKQTMTSHLAELEERGYIYRRVNPNDRREQHVFLTEYGQKFKFALLESVEEVEVTFANAVGEVELQRIESALEHLYQRLQIDTKSEIKNSDQALLPNSSSWFSTEAPGQN